MICAFWRAVLILPLFAWCEPLKAEPVSRTPPKIYREQLAALITPLDQVLAGREAFPKKDSHGVVLLDETVCFRDAAGTDYRIYHDVNLSNDDSATETMGNAIITYDREHESIFLIAAATIRPDGTRQDLDNRAAFIQSPQHEAENGLYTSNLELNLVFPKIVPGAITEFIVLVRVDKPVFPGEFAQRKMFAGGWPTYKSRLVVDLPEAVMQRVRAVAASPFVPEAQSEIPAKGRARKTWTRDRIPELEWEESAPSMEFRAPTLWLTTLESWDQVAAWFDDLVKDRSELGPDLEKELEGWTAGLTAPRDIIAKLCAVVANDVRYTGLEFGLAGYQPYPCAQIWANRYGDCKDKANLLRALLARKGIRSHLVLLSTERLGRIEKRSPSWKQFTHAILAVEEGPGAYFFCDPTIKHLPAGSIGRSDSARSVLVVRDRTADWVQTPDLLNHAIRYQADLVLAPSGELSGWFTLKAEGGDAAAYTEYYNNFDPPERRRTLQASLEGFFQGAEIVDLDYRPASGVVTDFAIRAYFIRKPNSTTVENIAFPYAASWLPSVGTNSTRKYPYATTRRVESLAVNITLPEGWNARRTPDPFSAVSTVARFTASWKNDPGRLQAFLDFQPEAAELAPADYAVFQRSVRALRSWMEQSVQVAHGEAVAQNSHAALSNFPVLATGEGQLRLLAQRFPPGENNPDRRVALEQVLQWFPDDIPTCFEAKIFLALIDSAKDYAKLSRQIQEVLARYDSHVSVESRAWARYLECRARWWAAQDPTAIKDLQALAADPALGGYRHSWSAYYAGLFLAEKEPAAALAYLKDFDTQPEEARDDMLKLEARLLAKLADSATTRAWAERLAKLPAEEADGLFDTVLEEVIRQRGDLPANTFPHFMESLVPVLKSAPGLTKTASQVARIKTIVAAGQLRRDFTKAVGSWVDAHPQPWITQGKSTQFADTAALLKYLTEKNDASQAREVVDGALQLIRYHEVDFPIFAKHLYWAIWWLQHDKLDSQLLAKLAESSYLLPTEESADIIEGWERYALALRADKKVPAARALYEKVIKQPGAKPYQRVEASGELAFLELDDGKEEAALAAFELTAKEHLTHRRGSEYLFAALLLNLELGRYERAMELLNALGKDEPKYRDAIRYADTLKYLLPDAGTPGPLLQYWQRRESWRPAWDQLLHKYGVAPSPARQLPLIDDIAALQKKIGAAATAKDTAAFLSQVDILVRNAQWTPLFVSNVCNQAAISANISQALYHDLYEFGLLLVQDFPPFDEVAWRSAQLWQAAMLADLKRPTEARPIAQKLFEQYGATHATGAAALRIWLLTSAELEGTAPAVAAAFTALKDGKVVNDRALTVETLSDVLVTRKDIAANIGLISGELNHPDIVAAAAVKTRLSARLEMLRKDASAGPDFSALTRNWLKIRRLDWLLDVPPLTLDQPRYANAATDGLYHDSPLSYSEETICNLRIALDENKPTDLRYRAFDAVAFATGFLAPEAEGYAEHFRSALLIKALPDEIRSQIYSGRIAFLLRFGHVSAAAKLLVTEEDPKTREHWRKVYDSSFAAARSLENYDATKAADAFKALAQEPVGAFESGLLKSLLARMVGAGDAPLASSLVEGAANLKVVAGSNQSVSGLRLDWTRLIRRETANLPFYRGIREILARHCPSTPADANTFRQLTWPQSMKSLDHQSRGQAIAAHFAQNLYSEYDPAEIIGLLDDAPTYVAPRRDLGPELATHILSAEIDDSTRARWFNAVAGLSDPDTPAVRARLVEVCQGFLARADASATAQTRRHVRRLLARCDLRNSTEARPESIFGRQAANEIDQHDVSNIQFAFHCSRQQTGEALAFLDKMDADVLANLFNFPYAHELLQSQGNKAELELLSSAAREKLANELASLWIEVRPFSVLHAAAVARLIHAEELMPDALFDHAADAQGDESDRQYIRLARAVLHQDWAAQRTAADAILRRMDEYYLAVFHRGEARFHLGDRSGAKQDLELFLSKALDASERPAAQRLLAAIAKK